MPKRAEHTGDRSALHSQASRLKRNASSFFAGKRHVWVEEVLPAQAATVPIWAGDSETMNERHLGKAEAESSQEVQKEKGVNRRGSPSANSLTHTHTHTRARARAHARARTHTLIWLNGNWVTSKLNSFMSRQQVTYNTSTSRRNTTTVGSPAALH